MQLKVRKSREKNSTIGTVIGDGILVTKCKYTILFIVECTFLQEAPRGSSSVEEYFILH